MKTKLFELRDRGTFIPTIAIEMNPGDRNLNASEYWLLRRAGYSHDFSCILFGRLEGEVFKNDPYEWGDRTFHVAHKFIEDNWIDLRSGDVIDVEFILQETTKKKISERLTSE